MSVALPPAFADLAPFASSWGLLATTDERFALRLASPPEAIRALYDAVAPRLDAIFEHLDRFALDELPQPEAQLFAICLGAIEAAQLVEIRWGTPPMREVESAVSLQWLSYP